MSKTKIEWSEEVWNPTTGCTKVSPGCAHCYAETLTKRYAGSKGWPAEFKPWTPANAAENVVLHHDRLEAPFSWRTPRRVFVNSMSDLFHEAIPDEFIDKVFAVMALTPQHTYQVLTKRPERMREYMTKQRTAHFHDGSEVHPRNPYHSADFVLWEADAFATNASWELRKRADDFKVTNDIDWFDWPLPNVWLGVTVENQRWADERIPILLDTPAAVRFVSAEPLLGPVTFGRWLFGDARPYDRALDNLDWIIIGGESGSGHRAFDPDWARRILHETRAAKVATFVKQLGGARPGSALEDLPEDLRVREYPA